MYCPNCGMQQVSGEMRFCSRCGLALSGLVEWLAGGLPIRRADESQISDMSPRRKGMQRGAKVMFFSGVLFPVFLAFSLLLNEGGPMIIPILVFFISLVMILYARLFSDKTATPTNPASTTSLRPMPPRNALPQVRTNELAQPPSVTEHTTRFLDNE